MAHCLTDKEKIVYFRFHEHMREELFAAMVALINVHPMSLAVLNNKLKKLNTKYRIQNHISFLNRFNLVTVVYPLNPMGLMNRKHGSRQYLLSKLGKKFFQYFQQEKLSGEN